MCSKRIVDHSGEGIIDKVSLNTKLMTGLLLIIIQIAVINKVVVCLHSRSGGCLCSS